MLILNKLIKKITQAQKVLLLTHKNPDGDALGSLVAMKLVLVKLGKSVISVCPDRLPAIFSFLPETRSIVRDFLLGDHDLVIILDCGDLSRTGFAERIKEFTRLKSRVVNIDHHSKNDIHRIAKINFIDYSASSTAELVYRIMNRLRMRLDKDIATSLLCGLYTDTGSFKHSNTTPEVLKIASALMRAGARLKKITQNITNGRSVSSLKLWGLVLSRIKTNPDLGLVTSVVTKQDLEDCQASPVDLAGAVNLINTIPQTTAAVLFSEIESGKIKASLRTESDKVDVSRLAQFFGGGGLKKAAGFTIDGHLVTNGDKGWKVEY